MIKIIKEEKNILKIIFFNITILKINKKLILKLDKVSLSSYLSTCLI